MKNKTTIGAVCTALLCAGGLSLGVFQNLEEPLQDALFQRNAMPNAHIQVIGIDQETIDSYGPFQSWSREKIGELIALLNADPETAPAVIAVDVVFAGAGDAGTDAELVRACSLADNVILASEAVYSTTVQQTASGYRLDASQITDVLEPFPALKQATRQGYINTILDADGVVRRASLGLRYQGVETLCLGVQAAQMYAEKNGTALTFPAQSDSAFDIRYTASSGAYYGGNSLYRVLEGIIPVERFTGDIVFIGAYTPGMLDAYLTAVDESTLMNGVEIHANIADALLSGRFFTDIPLWVQALALFILSGAFALLVWRQPLKKSTPVFLGLLVLYEGLLLLLCRGGIRIHALYFPVALLLIYLAGIVISYLGERRRRAAVTGMFKQYVAPAVVDSLLLTGEDLQQNRRRDIAVMFMDIRSFTSLSEKLEPEELVRILDRYLDLVTRQVFRYGGTIDKFIGDGVMVFFNAPVEQQDYELLAVRTALDIVEECRKVSEELRPTYGRDIMFGIGIHCGPAIVGNVGTRYRMDYTAIGDTVNTASRLEGLAPAGGVLISEEMRDRLSGRIMTEKVGPLTLKGKSKPVNCYRVKGLVEEIQPTEQRKGESV